MKILNNLGWVVHKEIYTILNNFLSNHSLISTSDKERIAAQIYSLVWDDLCSFTERDPAAKKSLKYVFRTYTCFRAVIANNSVHKEPFSLYSSRQSG